MAPNHLSVTELAYKLIDDLQPLMEMLSPSDQRIIEKFFDYILKQRVGNASITNMLPLEVALFLIQLEEHKENHHEITEIHNILQDMRREIRELRDLLNEET